MGGCSPPFHLPPHRRAFAYLPTVWLASWRIRLNCFFILCLVRSHLHTAGGNSPADLAQRDARCSWTEAQRRIQSPIFPFPHRRLPTPRTESGDYIFFPPSRLYLCRYIFVAFSFRCQPPVPAQGCWSNSPRVLAGGERQQ